MQLEEKKIGIAFTGSFCSFENAFLKLEEISNICGFVQTIFSFNAQKIDTRFGIARKFIERAEKITKRKPILSIEEAEHIGPSNYLDILVIFPCTGNTLAKLANAISDTPVLMAAKAQLRNQKPILIFVSTNDALGNNMKNIGLLLNSKNIYFVPFSQDNYKKKPNSIVSSSKYLIPAIEKALEKKQIQPVIL